MPQTNGYSNGHSNGNTTTYEMENGQSFLFTSESVGEGHPGEFCITYKSSFLLVPHEPTMCPSARLATQSH